MLKNTSKNAILYRGRYIRRLAGSGWGAECYIVVWAEDAGERGVERIVNAQTWYGCLAKLFAQIAYDDKFFGEYRWLI